MYVCISKGKDFTSWLIRFFTSILIRREAMEEDKINWFLASIYSLLSIFGITKYSKMKAEVNHCFFVYYSSDFKRWFAIDIRERGIVPVPAEKALSKCKSLFLLECNFDIWLGVRNVARYFGEGYDWLGIINAVFAILLFVSFGYRVQKIRNSHRRFVCSEFVVTAINGSNISTPLGDPMEIYPHLFYVLTKDNKNFKTLLKKDNPTVKDIEDATTNIL